MQSLFEDSGVHRDSNSQSGSSFGSVRVHSLTLSYTPRNMQHDFRASLLARNLARPYLGHEPKARVVTTRIISNMQEKIRMSLANQVHTWTRQKNKIQAYKVSNVDLLDLLKTLINDMSLRN